MDSFTFCVLLQPDFIVSQISANMKSWQVRNDHRAYANILLGDFVISAYLPSVRVRSYAGEYRLVEGEKGVQIAEIQAKFTRPRSSQE